MQVSGTMIGRIVYSTDLALALAIIFLVLSSSSVKLDMLLYNCLLVVAIVELGVMKFIDSNLYKDAASSALPGKRRTGPIVLGAFAASEAIYAILVHFLGATTNQSLVFIGISVIGYFLFSILAVKYDSLPSGDSEQ